MTISKLGCSKFENWWIRATVKINWLNKLSTILCRQSRWIVGHDFILSGTIWKWKSKLGLPSHDIDTISKQNEIVTDRPPVHTKTAILLLEQFENGRIRTQNSNRHNLKTASRKHLKTMKTMKTEYFSTLSKRGRLML